MTDTSRPLYRKRLAETKDYVDQAITFAEQAKNHFADKEHKELCGEAIWKLRDSRSLLEILIEAEDE